MLLKPSMYSEWARGSNVWLSGSRRWSMRYRRAERHSGVSRYLATRSEMPLTCRAKLEAIDLASRWKSELACKLGFCGQSIWQVRKGVLQANTG
jgi:hypothetical protein